jgi:hypothetical protein
LRDGLDDSRRRIGADRGDPRAAALAADVQALSASCKAA